VPEGLPRTARAGLPTNLPIRRRLPLPRAIGARRARELAAAAVCGSSLIGRGDVRLTGRGRIMARRSSRQRSGDRRGFGVWCLSGGAGLL